MEDPVSSTLRISPKALEDAELVGLTGDLEEQLRDMAARSAPVTHKYGNRRFHDFVLWVENEVVLGVERFGSGAIFT